MEIVPPHCRPTSITCFPVTYEPSERQIPPELARCFTEDCILSTDRRSLQSKPLVTALHSIEMLQTTPLFLACPCASP